MYLITLTLEKFYLFIDYHNLESYFASESTFEMPKNEIENDIYCVSILFKLKKRKKCEQNFLMQL